MCQIGLQLAFVISSIALLVFALRRVSLKITIEGKPITIEMNWRKDEVPKV